MATAMRQPSCPRSAEGHPRAVHRHLGGWGRRGRWLARSGAPAFGHIRDADLDGPDRRVGAKTVGIFARRPRFGRYRGGGDVEGPQLASLVEAPGRVNRRAARTPRLRAQSTPPSVEGPAGMTLKGDYVPSPSAWVRDQVAAYEQSGGQEANTLLDTGLPVVIVT